MSLNIPFLSNMLTEDTACVEQLTQLLMEERQLLEQRQLEGMQRIVGMKDSLLSNLAYSAKQRTQLLEAAGLPTDLNGWESFLLRDPSTRFLIPQWQALAQQFVACQKANDINGKMINRSKQTFTHLLNLIRGQAAPTSLYTPKGAASSYTSSYTVAKA